MADVVGYSRLMGEDETGTLAALKAHRKELIEPKSAEYHGRIVKLTGDGTLMEFGSAVDAVLFAVDVQRAILGHNAEVPEDRRITYRMGINIGDIIIDGDDIYGDGVNVAARNGCPLHPQKRTFRGSRWTSVVDPEATFGLDGLTLRPHLNSLAYTPVREETAHG